MDWIRLTKSGKDLTGLGGSRVGGRVREVGRQWQWMILKWPLAATVSQLYQGTRDFISNKSCHMMLVTSPKAVQCTVGCFFMPPFWKFWRGYIFLTPLGPKKSFCQKKIFKKVCLPLPMDLTFFQILKKIQVPGNLELSQKLLGCPSTSSSSSWRLRIRTGIMPRCCSWKLAYRTHPSSPAGC